MSNVETEKKIELEILTPKYYLVVFHNDNITTQEFVVMLLTQVFDKNQNEAKKIMLEIHNSDKGVVGKYAYSVAETKVAIANQLKKECDFPLRIEIKEE